MDIDVEPLRVALLQAASAPGNPEENLRRLDAAAASAAKQGSDLLITPEMFITGYNIGTRIAELAKHAPLERVAEIARRHRIGIIAGGPEAAPAGRVWNAAWFFDTSGEVLARHRKIQLFGAVDREHFIPGNASSTAADFRGWRIALLICFDVEYPEAVRAAALDGADLVAVPTAQMEPFEFVNEQMIPVRAWENALFVAYVNQIGPDGGFDYVGRSTLADPFGRRLAWASPAAEEILTAELHPSVLVEARRQNTYLDKVRSELYQPPSPRTRSGTTAGNASPSPHPVQSNKEVQ